MSLLLQRDLLSFAIVILLFLVVFALMAATQRTAPNRRRPK